MTTEVSGKVDEKDGTVTIGEGDGAVRYVKESDLLALKEGRKSKEEVAVEVQAAAVAATAAATAEANTKLETEHQKVLEAETKVSGLEEKIAKGGVSETELAGLKTELATAKSSGEELGNKFLTMKGALIVATYGVPQATVEGKTIAELDSFDAALKAVVGMKGVGNYAIGAGGGGASPLENKSPMELAQMAYSETKK